MSEDLRQLIDEAIKMELNVAEVYIGFHHRFREDAAFWWKLAIEEENHAGLLESGEQYFLDAGMFPGELVDTSLNALVNANHELERMLIQEREAPMSRESAFNHAIKLEELAEEIHFQHAMQEKRNSSESLKVFQSLNAGDKDHADRIRNYMHQNGIRDLTVALCQ